MNKNKVLMFLVALLLSVVMGCNLTEQESLSDKNLSIDVSPRSVQTWSLWEPLNYFNSSVWEKANWTNNGFFDCGFIPQNISFNNGQMALKLDNTESFGKKYSGAEYRTKNTFSYGFFETNMIAVKAPGTVTSFFLYSDNPWDEIDVEILGKDTTKVQFNYFVDGVGNHEAIIDLGFDASEQYHKYTIEYGNGYINWYVDGVWKYGANNTGFNAPYGEKFPSHPMNIMVNLWPGIGVDDWLEPFNYYGPYYAYYDYILYRTTK